MKSKRYISIAIALAIFAIMSNIAMASTWYVATATGNDANSGNSAGNAKKTIQAMVSSASVLNGDIVIVGDGTYTEQVKITNKSITLKSTNGAASTIIKAPTFTSMTSYTDGSLVWVTGGGGIIGHALPSGSFRPVVYVDCPNSGYTNNIYGFTIDGDNQGQRADLGDAFATENLIGIMFKYSAGNIGSSAANQPMIITNCQVRGANPEIRDDRNGYGIMLIASTTVQISNCTINNYQSAGIASIGKTTVSANASQNPNPTVIDCSIRGSDANSTNAASVNRNNTGWYTGILIAYGGRGTYRKNIISDHYNKTDRKSVV